MSYGGIGPKWLSLDPSCWPEQQQHSSFTSVGLRVEPSFNIKGLRASRPTLSEHNVRSHTDLIGSCPTN